MVPRLMLHERWVQTRPGQFTLSQSSTRGSGATGAPVWPIGSTASLPISSGGPRVIPSSSQQVAGHRAVPTNCGWGSSPVADGQVARTSVADIRIDRSVLPICVAAMQRGPPFVAESRTHGAWHMAAAAEHRCRRRKCLVWGVGVIQPTVRAILCHLGWTLMSCRAQRRRGWVGPAN